MRFSILACLALIGVTAPAWAASLTEDEATNKAIKYMMNTDYGDSYSTVINHIKERQFVTMGTDDCGPVTKPVWAFRVQGPYNGWLYLDATTGDKVCSTLPFLR